MSNKRNILIGGAWPYANSNLHIGHLAALISGDFLKRYHELLGDNVLYVSGSDCHGTPITERAINEGVSPEVIAGKYHNEFVDIFNRMNFSYDLYGNTMDEFHKEKVKEMFLKMYNNGYIYEKQALQPYCEVCGKFESDRELEITCPNCGSVTKADQCDCGYVPTIEYLKGSKCRKCGNTTIEKTNTHLYLALSKLQGKIEEYVNKNKDNWRVASINETEKYLKEGLLDRAVTRDLSWGVDIPLDGFNDKKMYVWVEAVLGYITMTMKVCEEKGLNWEEYWKEGNDIKMYMCHGKDNITFHTVILPGLLLAMNENYHLPDTMVATQYVNINAEKISKSKGNGITVKEMLDTYNIDSLRYYMLSRGPENKDIDFTLDNFIGVHNSDLVNKFGNFVNRTLKFKNLDLIKVSEIDKDIDNIISEKYSVVRELIEKLEIRKACQEIIDLVEIGNKYYDERMPWVQAKEDIDGFNNTMYTCANVILNLSNLLEMVMPTTCDKIRKYLGYDKAVFEKVIIDKDIKLDNIEVLFERI